MSTENDNVIGYYRWTNIYFNWPDYFEDNKTVQSALRSFLHPNSMMDPNHPLYDKEEEGIVMWIGTLQNGKMRLMFSAAQVEYARYWLASVGIGRYEDIKIPDSSYLLQDGIELQAVSPAVFKTVKELKDANKEVEKRSKRVFNDEKLILQRAQFEKARNVWHARGANWIAIDFESWEMDHTVITEVGVSVQQYHDSKGETIPRKTTHYIIKEHIGYRNGKYVPDNQAHFHFGTSETLPAVEVIQRLKKSIEYYSVGAPLFLVFHGGLDDVKILQRWKVPIGNHQLDDIYTDEYHPGDVYLFDTTNLFCALCGNAQERQNLGKMAGNLNVGEDGAYEVYDLHNAGNDAHYTLDCLISMVSGEPVDAQRERRWPFSGSRKDFNVVDEELDADEDELPIDVDEKIANNEELE